MVPTIVIDDEIHNLNELCRLINETEFMSVKGRYQSPLKALDEIGNISPQVAFVDIDLPEMDGITFADRVLELNPSVLIVFVTAYNQYAIQAFEINALDYIMKPISVKRFDIMVKRIRQQLDIKAMSAGSKLTVNMFGKLDVKIGDEPILWKRSTAEEVFAYLMVNYGSFVHKESIIESILPDYEFSAALSILKTSICRIRSVFSSLHDDVKIVYSGGRYCLKFGNEIDSDYIEVCKAISNYRIDSSTYEVIENACNLYGDGLLTQQGYIWSIEKDEQLRKSLINAMDEIAQQYNSQGNDNAYIKALRILIKLEPYSEQSNFALLERLEKIGEIQQLVMHYKWLEKVLAEEYEIIPGKRINEKFSKYIKKS